MTEKKLLKKAKKLVKWARKHGYEHIDMFTLRPDKNDPRWYSHITVRPIGGKLETTSRFYEDGELDE